MGTVEGEWRGGALSAFPSSFAFNSVISPTKRETVSLKVEFSALREMFSLSSLASSSDS